MIGHLVADKPSEGKKYSSKNGESPSTDGPQSNNKGKGKGKGKGRGKNKNKNKDKSNKNTPVGVKPNYVECDPLQPWMPCTPEPTTKTAETETSTVDAGNLMNAGGARGRLSGRFGNFDNGFSGVGQHNSMWDARVGFMPQQQQQRRGRMNGFWG